MLAIATSPTIFASKKGFKRLSKKIKRDRDMDVDKIKGKLSDIVRYEQRRLNEYYKEHEKLIKKDEKSKPKKSVKKSIDLYEK